jgi:ATP-dependent Clp protease ATP-binding subunit ClpA
LKSISKLRRARAGLAEADKPLWSFLFLWPTGVWKTETAKTLAEVLFDNKQNFIRIDMSEYMEKHAVSRLIGSPPGYIGHDEWGQLTEAVRRKPYSVILFDEVEKAHPDVFNVLLQVFDDGRLTDSKGRTVNFKNTIIIMTSNIGSRILQERQTSSVIPRNEESLKQRSISDTSTSFHSAQYDNNKISPELMNELKKYFRPEFLNRIDDIIVFNPLSEAMMMSIVDVLLDGVTKLLAERKIEAIFTENLKKYLISVGYDTEFGARPMKRAITNVIMNPLSNAIISEQIQPGQSIRLDVDERGELQLI